MLSMRPAPRLRLTSASRGRSLAAALAATALALAALAGCSTGGSGGSGTSNGSGTGADAAASAGGPSATGFDGALLPGDVSPHEFTLTDQYGRRVSLRALRGRVVILAFLYTASKTTAPLIAQQIRGALDELESQASGVSALAVSVDPAADTPAHIRAFLRENSLTGRLDYLTGSLAQLRPIWRGYHVVPAGAGPRAYEEGAFVVLLDRAGAERVDFPLEELTPEALAHDVRKLQGE
jgi:protein SCO1